MHGEIAAFDPRSERNKVTTGETEDTAIIRHSPSNTRLLLIKPCHGHRVDKYFLHVLSVSKAFYGDLELLNKLESEIQKKTTV